ncbi:MAG: four-carbon acid sugar kinase family protein, partial [bacterium]
MEIAKEKEIKYLYKKTDSTLRGNIGIEFLAIWKTYNRPVMFIPAFPKLKRFTRNGVQYIDDTPINMTSFSKDPLNPVRESYIPKIIEEQAKLKSSIVKRDYYNNISIIDSDVYIFDAELDKDLLTIGETLKRKDTLKITAGCAGFAEILPKLIDFKRDRKQVNLNIKGDYIVIICGSMNERSLKQIEFAKEKLGFLDIVLSKEEISNPHSARVIFNYNIFHSEEF